MVWLTVCILTNSIAGTFPCLPVYLKKFIFVSLVFYNLRGCADGPMGTEETREL
jgi:hypothetical protein